MHEQCSAAIAPRRSSTAGGAASTAPRSPKERHLRWLLGRQGCAARQRRPARCLVRRGRALGGVPGPRDRVGRQDEPPPARLAARTAGRQRRERRGRRPPPAAARRTAWPPPRCQYLRARRHELDVLPAPPAAPRPPQAPRPGRARGAPFGFSRAHARTHPAPAPLRRWRPPPSTPHARRALAWRSRSARLDRAGGAEQQQRAARHYGLGEGGASDEQAKATNRGDRRALKRRLRSRVGAAQNGAGQAESRAADSRRSRRTAALRQQGHGRQRRRAAVPRRSCQSTPSPSKTGASPDALPRVAFTNSKSPTPTSRWQE